MIARILSWLLTLRRADPEASLRHDYRPPDVDRLTVALRGDGTAAREGYDA